MAGHVRGEMIGPGRSQARAAVTKWFEAVFIAFRKTQKTDVLRNIFFIPEKCFWKSYQKDFF
jgi:hypothetical protein